MHLSELCVKRPVFATVLNLFLVVIGIISYMHLQVRQMPNIDSPNITIESEYPGANPKIVETQLTRLLEGAFATIPGVDLITSQSSKDTSKVMLEFSPDRDPDGASADVRDRLSTIKAQLPKGIPEPQIKKSSSDSSPCIVFAFSSDTMGIDDIRDYIERFIKSNFEIIDGVGGVDILGGNRKQMKTFLDPQRLNAYNLTAVDVYEAIVRQHIQKPIGKIVSKDKEYMLNITGELKQAHEFDNLIIPFKNNKEKIIRLHDVGETKLTHDDVKESVTFNGKDMVCINIKKQSTANPVELSAKVKEKLKFIKQLLPKEINMITIRDDADQINESISNVYHAIIEATILVVLVVFFFLWSLRATLVPLVTIPVSLIGTFILLELFGFTINTFTLLALVLAVGLVVDDAIVVLENIHRYIESGKTKIQAAIEGAKEIGFSIIAMTFTLAAAYLPIAFTPGKLGRSFREFALALAGSVIISGFIALTLSPMMCSFLLEKKKKSLNISKVSIMDVINFKKEAYLRMMEIKYGQYLELLLQYKYIVLVFCLSIFAFGCLVGNFIPSENVPEEDEGFIIVRGEGPKGVSHEYMAEQAKVVDRLLTEIPFQKYRYLKADTNEISGWVELCQWNQRDKTSQEISKAHSDKFKYVAGVNASIQPGSSGGALSNTVDFVLQTNENFKYLFERGAMFAANLFHKYPGIDGAPLTSIIQEQLEYNLEIDREKSSATGVSADDIVTAVEICFRGKKSGEVQRGSQRDEMFLQLDSMKRRTIEDLSGILLRSNLYNERKQELELVPLSELVHVKKNYLPLSLAHHNQMLSFLVSMRLKEGFTVGQVTQDLEHLVKAQLPDNIYITFTGDTKKFLEDSKQLMFIFFLALLFVFFILAMQFESFVDPLIIMFSVPLSITGAFLALYFMPHGSFNIYSKVGLVTLIGLITKHGILIVDFSNNLMAKGYSSVDAVIEGAKLRLRPILMTTFAMVLGAIPLAFASGIGAVSRQQIGWCIVGGMSIGTFFTLFCLPAVYVIFQRLKPTINRGEAAIVAK